MKSTSGRRRVSRLLDSIAFLALALVLAWLAGTSIVRQTHYVDLYRAARTLERGQKLSLAAVERRSNDIERLIATRDCDDASLRSGVTLSLAAIERRNPALDFEGWAEALERGRQLLRVAAACSPHRGGFWARLAVVERLIAASPGRVVPLAALSIRLAPAELGVIRTRFQLWRTASTWMPADASAPLQADMRTILRQAQLTDIRQMIGNSAALKQLAGREALQMDGERQTELARLRFNEAAGAKRANRPRFDLLDKPRP
ncbi:hypothetical protein [Aureimonas leprariae]|uniref:Uncharacterized protein n=1 Tax=Plantimonas leprariae TaxID=2615207 RepID=A0A7V7PN33_9HYPH|nr:hypothetical protein [Aureimonas leprariae]KAB0678861.1 hypothetical protein F6X38_15395 [Aureimonas leprariae]